MTDLTEALTAEIARVTAKKDRWQGYQLLPPVVGLRFMAMAIEAATRALASGDTTAMHASLEDLKGYGNDD